MRQSSWCIGPSLVRPSPPPSTDVCLVNFRTRWDIRPSTKIEAYDVETRHSNHRLPPLGRGSCQMATGAFDQGRRCACEGANLLRTQVVHSPDLYHGLCPW